MARLLFTVEDTFFIQGRGLIPFPGIIPVGSERFRIGDSILLKRTDGTELKWPIAGIEMVFATPPQPNRPLVMSLEGLTKADVPIGTEVWSVD